MTIGELTGEIQDYVGNYFNFGRTNSGARELDCRVGGHGFDP